MTQETQQGTVDLPPVRYSIADATIAEKRAEHAHLLEIEVTDDESYALVKGAHLEWKRLRTGLDKERLSQTQSARDWQKKVNDEAKRLTAEISAVEEQLGAKRRAWEDRVECEKRAAEEAERVRVNDIMERIDEIKRVPMGVAHGTPDQIVEAGHRVRAIDTASEDLFGEFMDTAVAAKLDALDQLRVMHEKAVEREEEAEALRKRQEELREQEEAQKRREAELEARERELAEREAPEVTCEGCQCLTPVANLFTCFGCGAERCENCMQRDPEDLPFCAECRGKLDEAKDAVCDYCDGTGRYVIGGNDILTDPPEEVMCDECGGTGKAQPQLTGPTGEADSVVPCVATHATDRPPVPLETAPIDHDAQRAGEAEVIREWVENVLDVVPSSFPAVFTPDYALLRGSVKERLDELASDILECL